MRSFLFICLCTLLQPSEAQVEVKGKWNVQGGVSSNNAFSYGKPCVNIRYVSPRFKWSEDWNLDEEKQPDKYRNMRIMLELMCGPCLRTVCSSVNAQYRLIKCKRFTTYISGGLKVLFVSGNDFNVPGTRANHRDQGWYMNMGLVSQFDLGPILPFVDIGGDRIITIGTEVNLQKIYKKPKGRYKLKPIPVK
jgi:hypothetical protein